MLLTTDHAAAAAGDLEGRLVEICACPSGCPCWAVRGQPVTGCGSVVAWYVDRGVIDGVDVSGCVVAATVHPPIGPTGDRRAGGWRTEIIVDERCTPAQATPLLRAFTHALGCALADVAFDQPDHPTALTRHRALHRVAAALPAPNRARPRIK